MHTNPIQNWDKTRVAYLLFAFLQKLSPALEKRKNRWKIKNEKK